jgi:predicted nucleic acid-binding protein
VTAIVDAAPLIALADALDPRLEAVRAALEAEQGELIVPAPVTAEVDYLLNSRVSRSSARQFWRDLGLADLSVILLARRFRTTRILTFDARHFRAVTPLQGGAFTLLPDDA